MSERGYYLRLLWRRLRGHRTLRARLMGFWWFACRYYGEDCQQCGARYVSWWSPSDLWERVVGSDGPFLLCLHCFDRKAQAVGVTLLWLPQAWLEPGRERTWDTTTGLVEVSS